MRLPTPYVIEHLAHVPGGLDAHGNPVSAWAEPVPLPVHGWSPPSQDTEPGQANRDLVVRDLDVYAPAGTAVGPHDRVRVEGVLYEVVGHPEDYTRGPWQWAAGVRLNLLRVEG